MTKTIYSKSLAKSAVCDVTAKTVCSKDIYQNKDRLTTQAHRLGGRGS